MTDTLPDLTNLMERVWAGQLTRWRGRAERKVWAEPYLGGWRVLYEHYFDYDRGGSWWGSEEALRDLDADDAATLVELIIDGRSEFVHNLDTT